METIDNLKNEAPIVKETSDLYKLFYTYLKLFPKKDQYTIGKRCEDVLLQFLELIVFATSQSREHKRKTLERANVKFDMLKMLFRISRDLQILDNKKYIDLEEQAQKIGRMLGGWIRSLR